MLKLAGHLPLADMISQIIDDSRAKLAADESAKDEKSDKKPSPFEKKDDKAKKPNPFEKKEEKDVKEGKRDYEEKNASAIDFSNPEEIDKLASALEQVGEQFVKVAADEKNHGGEFKGGGESLAVMKAVPGRQPYKKDSSKAHNVPTSTGLQKGDVGAASTQVPNDHAKAPGGAAYPAKGVFKTASESVLDRLRAAAEQLSAEKKQSAKEEPEAEKKSSASPVDYILGKIANVEKQMGGMTLDSKSGDGPKPPSNPGRELIESNTAATNAKKVQAKAPQKKLMSQVLTEPALSKAHDSKVHENLRNATKGGVKIAAARELLKKIAEEGCSCDGKGECKHCKMKKAMEKKSMGGMSMPSTPPPPPPAPTM